MGKVQADSPGESHEESPEKPRGRAWGGPGGISWESAGGIALLESLGGRRVGIPREKPKGKALGGKGCEEKVNKLRILTSDLLPELGFL